TSSGTPNPHNTFDLQLLTPPTPAEPGFYSIVLGPNLSDYSGNRMDQNQNNVGGEISADMYSTRILYQGFANARPGLSAAPVTFAPALDEDDVTNPGTDLATWIASLPAGTITDADDANYASGTAPRGIAVTAVNNTHGRWQY